ncbi:MAG: lytic transglycosylase domain-containing protein, partial [Pseudomonadales bacterium]
IGLATAQSNSPGPEEIDTDLLAYLKHDVLEEHGFTDPFEAEVWYESMLPRMQQFEIAHREKIQILQSVHSESNASGVSPNLVLAVIEVESGFDRFAISRAGAQGLMQVMTFWKKELGRPEDNLTDPHTNLRYGTSILSYYLELSKGDTTEALSRYNGSYPQTWYAERVYRAMSRWQH